MIKATLINHNNDDALIVDAARASFAKTSDNYTPEQNERLIAYLARYDHWTPFSHVRITIPSVLDPLILFRLSQTDIAGIVWNEQGDARYSFHGWANLIQKGCFYKESTIIMETLKHYCPVSYEAYGLPEVDARDWSTHVDNHYFIDETFLYEVPIFVARQEFKHMIGFTRNERSGRYVTSDPEFYTPDVWRSKPDGSIKQGSGGDHELNSNLMSAYKTLMSRNVDHYSSMVSLEVAPEMARMVLPQSMMTSYYVTGSLSAYKRMIEQRLDSTAQKEIRDLAIMVDQAIKDKYGADWRN